MSDDQTRGELAPLDDPRVDWDDMSRMKTLTCVNHPTAVYLTKNPWTRTLHLIEFPVEAADEEWNECPCEFSDLRVVLEEGDQP